MPRLWPLLALLMALLALPANAASERQLKEAELKQLRERITSLQQAMQQVRNQHDRLQQELRRSEQAINRLNRNILELDARERDTRQRVDSLRTRQQGLEQTLIGQREYLAGQVRAAYAMGRQETLKILLNQENPATVGRVMTYYDYLNKARTQRIAELSDTIHELDQVRSALDKELARLRQLRNTRETEREALAENSEQRQQVLAKLQQELQSQDQRLSHMQRNEQQLAQLIRALVEALDDIPKDIGREQAFASLRGKMKLPTNGPIIAGFGSSRNLGKLNWQGLKIAAPAGQEVRAVSHGRVAFADWLRGYGLLIILDHGDGYMSLYGHNQTLLKEVGDWVGRDEIIAATGDSGSDPRSGLYFEIRKDGRPIDPIRWVRR
ncbi:MAG: murein hydrolase activator EnvC family protein [Thiohalomonadaceae bacterium]